VNDKKSKLPRVLSTFDGIAIMVGITIGAGIFATPSKIATYFDSFNTIIGFWILIGGFVFIGGLIYAELGTRLPNTGGEYVYIRRAFGPLAGFMFGWSQLFIIRTSAVAGLALVASEHLGYFVELSGPGRTALALSIILILGVVNYTGMKQGSFYQRLSTILKILGLLTLVVGGLVIIDDETSLLGTVLPPADNLGPVGSVAAAAMLIVFSYVGWDRVGYVAGEMKNPRATVPVAMIAGMTVLILIYVSVNMVYHQTLGMEGVRASPITASDTAGKLFGPWGAALIAITVVISTTGSSNGNFMTAPRVYFAMARDGLLFKWLNYVHPRFKTPSRAIIAHSVWGAVILLARGSFEAIAVGMVFAALIFYVMTTLALFKFRKNGTGGSDVFKVPLFPLLPAIYLAGIVILLVVQTIYQWKESLISLVLILSGLPAAYFWRDRIKKGSFIR